MTFDTVFDITTRPYVWHYPAFGLIFIFVGVVWSYGRRHDPKRLRRWMPRAYALFAILWVSVVFAGTFSEWYYGRRAVRQGTAQVVQGTVEDFVPMPVQGHSDERFSVKGVPFSYSDYTMTSTFCNTSSHGGPIRPGLVVRIHYRGNNILKLEIARSTSP